MPLCAAAYGKATKVERARRPAYFINYYYLKLSGERLGWIYNIIIYTISTRSELRKWGPSLDYYNCIKFISTYLNYLPGCF
jgi:hypothetical protein